MISRSTWRVVTTQSRIRGGSYRLKHQWSSGVVRRTFVDYFCNNHGAVFVPSSTVDAASTDHSLFFTNAGMNQFKSIFLGEQSEQNSLKRAVNSQKCIRLSGKLNDLSLVGNDAFHHTFFEMLGNWGFNGNLSKRDAIEQAWSLLTDVFKLPPERLFVSYFGGDERLKLDADLECRDVWLTEVGIPKDRVIPLGTEHNFWEMGSTGPCGPCTEIHYAFGDNPCFSQSRELWNLVFMQYNRKCADTLESLPSMHVDTGMGFERLCALLQGSLSNYQSDLFIPLLTIVANQLNLPPYRDLYSLDDCSTEELKHERSMRLIADHSRMLCAALADGVLPSKQGQGHLLRKIIRNVSFEVLRYCGSCEVLLAVIDETINILGDSFPEMERERSNIKSVVHDEFYDFKRLLRRGRRRFKSILVKCGKITKQDMLFLHTLAGLPIELICHLAIENGIVPPTENDFQLNIEQLRLKSELGQQDASERFRLKP